MIPQAKERLLQAYEKVSARTSETDLERQRIQFLERYPPQELARLRGPALLNCVHGSGSRDGLFYDLEFGDLTKGFGSVSGASALEFKVYRTEEGGWRKKGRRKHPVRCSEKEAIGITEHLVRALTAAIDLTDHLGLASGEREVWADFQNRLPGLQPSGYDPPLVELELAHKYLALARPEVFSFRHNARYLKRHLVHLGVLPEEQRYVLDWQWRHLRLSDGDLSQLNPVLLWNALFDLFGSGRSFWRVGTGQKGEQWPSMRDGNFISVGWDQIGNLAELLKGLVGQEAKKRLNGLLAVYGYSPQQTGEETKELYDFYESMQINDRIAAMYGGRLLGVGVVESEYEYVPGGPHPHHRRIRWVDLNPQQFAESKGLQTTVYDLSDKYPQALHIEAIIAPTPESPVAPPELRRPPPLTEFESRILAVLERKGQVILFGPPGTGKTYHARGTALELVSRDLWGKAWAALADHEKGEVDLRVRFCTFHPAYSYEDFIEGYRPTTTVDGTPKFELKDGFFLTACEVARNEPERRHILVIDEINRANVPAVMGELITLLEIDKRETLEATLPVSKRRFSVPRNLWIIGTMNTADRSISLLDAALRRRFGFIELLPEPARVESRIEDLRLSLLLRELNDRIRRHISRNARELQIGHAYFMKSGNPIASKEELLQVMRDDVIPLLMDYCFENFSVLHDILGDDIVNRDDQFVRPDVLHDPSRLYTALLRLVSHNLDLMPETEAGAAEDEVAEGRPA